MPSEPARRFTLRPARLDECAAAGRLHVEGIPTGFLSALGPRFLDHLYRRVLRWDGGLLLVAVEEPAHGGPGTVVGFIATTTSTKALYKQFLLHDAIPAALAALGPLVTGWRRVVETLRHGTSDGPGLGRGAELLAIAVDPSARGAGLGRQLVEAFLADVQARGGSEAYTVTAADNPASVALYRACGFVPASEFELHPGTTSLVMQWDLPRS